MQAFFNKKLTLISLCAGRGTAQDGEPPAPVLLMFYDAPVQGSGRHCVAARERVACGGDFADGVEELVKNAAGRDPEVLQDQQIL